MKILNHSGGRVNKNIWNHFWNLLDGSVSQLIQVGVIRPNDLTYWKHWHGGDDDTGKKQVAWEIGEGSWICCAAAVTLVQKKFLATCKSQDILKTEYSWYKPNQRHVLCFDTNFARIKWNMRDLTKWTKAGTFWNIENPSHSSVWSSC